MKLEIKHLAPYLTTQLLIQCPRNYVFIGTVILGTPILELKAVNNEGYLQLHSIAGFYPIKDFKPILRPLSDLTKEIDYNGDKFIAQRRTSVWLEHGVYVSRGINLIANRIRTNTITYSDMELLISLHFDVFNLIPEGLAIDINTIE